MKWKIQFYMLVTVIMIMLFAMAGPAGAKTSTAPQPPIDPNNFVSRIDNPYFPLKPGTTFNDSGQKEGVVSSDIMEVLRRTKTIIGVAAKIVHHRSYEGGVLVEDTFDWYAQDKQGNVWYFGEDTKELDASGNVISTEGSWQAGVNAAQPGIVMEANPKKGDKYQQEFLKGVAEDMAQVIGFQDSLCVTYGCFSNVLVTKEWSPLEQGVVENKYYAKGVGFIYGEMVKGGNETTQLVSVSK